MVQKIAVYLGLRTSCCAAKIETWHANKFYCSECHSSLGKPASQAQLTKSKATRKPAVHRPAARTHATV